MLWSLLKLIDLTTRREDTKPQYQSCLLQSPQHSCCPRAPVLSTFRNIAREAACV